MALMDNLKTFAKTNTLFARLGALSARASHDLAPRDRRALHLGALGLALLVIYFCAVEPLLSRYHDLLAQHEALASRVARAVYLRDKNAYLASRISQYEQDNGPLLDLKSSDRQISAVGEQIVAAAQANGIELKGTTPSAPTAWPDDPSLQMAVLRIEAQADWEKTFEFIAALYRIGGVLSVEQLEMTGDPKKGGKITLRLGVSVLAASSPHA